MRMTFSSSISHVWWLIWKVVSILCKKSARNSTKFMAMMEEIILHHQDIHVITPRRIQISWLLASIWSTLVGFSSFSLLCQPHFSLWVVEFYLYALEHLMLTILATWIWIAAPRAIQNWAVVCSSNLTEKQTTCNHFSVPRVDHFFHKCVPPIDSLISSTTKYMRVHEMNTILKLKEKLVLYYL